MCDGDGVEVADGREVRKVMTNLAFAAKVEFEVETFRRSTEFGFQSTITKIRQDCNARGQLHSSICANHLAAAYIERAKSIGSAQNQ